MYLCNGTVRYHTIHPFVNLHDCTLPVLYGTVQNYVLKKKTFKFVLPYGTGTSTES